MCVYVTVTAAAAASPTRSRIMMPAGDGELTYKYRFEIKTTTIKTGTIVIKPGGGKPISFTGDWTVVSGVSGAGLDICLLLPLAK